MKYTADITQALVIDFQQKLMPVMDNKDILESNTCILLKGLKALGIPVTVTQQYTRGIGMTVNTIAEAAGLEADGSGYFDKLHFSCYADESIRAAVDAKGRKAVIVCGIEAHICVLQTCLDLKAAGYEPVLVTDCISSRKASDKAMAVNRAIQEGIAVTTYESILFELTGKAGSDTFKTISKLIK